MRTTLSEHLVIDAIRLGTSRRCDPRRGIRASMPACCATTGPTTAGPGVIDPLDWHRELCERDPVLLRQHRLVVDDRAEASGSSSTGTRISTPPPPTVPHCSGAAPVRALNQGDAVRLRGQPCGSSVAAAQGQRAADRAGDPDPSADGQRRAVIGVHRERPFRRIRPERRALTVGRGHVRADRRAGRCGGHRPRRRPVVESTLRGPRTSVVAAPARSTQRCSSCSAR